MSQLRRALTSRGRFSPGTILKLWQGSTALMTQIKPLVIPSCWAISLAMSVDATLGVGDADTSRRIIQLGTDGWELVNVEGFTKDGTTTQLAYFFKRPK